MADPRFKTGARPSPRYLLQAVEPFVPIKAPLPQFAIIPKQLDMWGNDQYGDCVTAEEAFAKACYSPEIFIPAQTVIDWARRHGVLNGADLASVMDAFQSDGFQVGNQKYNDGRYTGVDYSNESVLQSAVDQGPVKIAIASSALPQGAGNHQGWSAFGGGRHSDTDHCVTICGHGPTSWLFQQLGVSPPSQMPTTGYLLYTWSTIGVVDHPWLMGTCVEAWLRNPTTVGIPPLSPPTPPTPPVPPTPPPFPGQFQAMLQVLSPADAAGNYTMGGGGLTPAALAALQSAVAAIQSVIGPAPNWPGTLTEEQHKALLAEASLRGLPRTINWLELIKDVIKLFNDFQTFDVRAIVADVQAIIKDLGF